MKFNELKKYSSDAPKKGQLLAYSREKVVFESYSSQDEIESILKKNHGNIDPDLLEIHLFDKSKEYRAIFSKRGEKGHFIEYSAAFSDDSGSGDVYKETVYLESTFAENNKLTILNHISYDENGVASIDDYRLVMEG